jgi:hypothetical protein
MALQIRDDPQHITKIDRAVLLANTADEKMGDVIPVPIGKPSGTTSFTFETTIECNIYFNCRVRPQEHAVRSIVVGQTTYLGESNTTYLALEATGSPEHYIHLKSYFPGYPGRTYSVEVVAGLAVEFDIRASVW